LTGPAEVQRQDDDAVRGGGEGSIQKGSPPTRQTLRETEVYTERAEQAEREEGPRQVVTGS